MYLLWYLNASRGDVDGAAALSAEMALRIEKAFGPDMLDSADRNGKGCAKRLRISF